jgi:hypothetical protein
MEKEVIDEAFFLPTLFRLFKTGSVFTFGYRFKPYSVLGIFMGPSVFKTASRYSAWKNQIMYTLDKEESFKLKIFIEKIQKLLKEIISPHKEKLNHIIVSIEMYNNVFLNTRPYEGKDFNWENQVSYLSSSLEALFLTKSEEGTITRRLTQRIAILLKIFGFKPKNVVRHVKTAYKVRSAFNHGSAINLKNILKLSKCKNLKEFLIVLVEYVRYSILIFLQLYKIIKKRDLLILIDNSLLKLTSYYKIVKLIRRNCIIYR